MSDQRAVKYYVVDVLSVCPHCNWPLTALEQ